MTPAGKGDNPRPVNRKKYEKNFDKIFGDKAVRTARKKERDAAKKAKRFRQC